MRPQICVSGHTDGCRVAALSLQLARQQTLKPTNGRYSRKTRIKEDHDLIYLQTVSLFTVFSARCAAGSFLFDVK